MNEYHDANTSAILIIISLDRIWVADQIFHLDIVNTGFCVALYTTMFVNAIIYYSE